MAEQAGPGSGHSCKQQEAARLRAIGTPWSVVAERLGYQNGKSAQASIVGYKTAAWADAWTAAIQAAMPDIESEAMTTQRELMRATGPVYGPDGKPMSGPDGKPLRKTRDEKIRQSAAHSLLNHSARMKAQRIEIKHSGQTSVTLSGELTIERARAMTDEELRKVAQEKH